METQAERNANLVGQRAQADTLVQARLQENAAKAQSQASKDRDSQRLNPKRVYDYCFAGVSDATRAPDGELPFSLLT